MGSLKETYNKSVQCFFSQKSLHPIVEDAGLKINVISFFLKRIPFLVLVFHACCYDICIVENRQGHFLHLVYKKSQEKMAEKKTRT